MKEPVSRNEVNKEAFGRRLTQAMEERRETTYSMADSVSLTASTISRYANGKMAPKIPTLFQLADHLQVNPLWLMGYDRPREQARAAGFRSCRRPARCRNRTRRKAYCCSFPTSLCRRTSAFAWRTTV